MGFNDGHLLTVWSLLVYFNLKFLFSDAIRLETQAVHASCRGKCRFGKWLRQIEPRGMPADSASSTSG
jgi:hypothetical protein